MEDLPFQKVAISGPTLTSIIQRVSTSTGDINGLLFGHVSLPSISPLSDDDTPITTAGTLIATITSFITTTTAFYSSSGEVDPILIRKLVPSLSKSSLIGWFSGRCKSQLRPSLREYTVSRSFASNPQFSFPVVNSDSHSLPCLFFLFTTPVTNQVVHTHEYLAYQFRTITNSFEAKSVDVVNIGPAFRGNYDSFSPNSPFPLVHYETRVSPMVEDKDERSLQDMKRIAKDQGELDVCAEGFEIGSLRRLMGSEAVNYTVGLEDLYEKMLAKLDGLARLVENSSAKVIEQENHNMKLRYKLAGLD